MSAVHGCDRVRENLAPLQMEANSLTHILSALIDEMSLALLGGLLFFLLARRLKLAHYHFWTALGVFFGLFASLLILPLMFFAERQPKEDAPQNNASETTENTESPSSPLQAPPQTGTKES